MIPLPSRRTVRHLGCSLIAIPIAVISVFVMAVGPFPPPSFPSADPRPLPSDFMKGISYEEGRHGEFSSTVSDKTLSQLIAPLGVNWIALVVKCTQPTRVSTDIICNTNGVTATDEDIAHVVQYAHSLGLRVMFKPHVDLGDHSVDRYQISFGRDNAAWQRWFASYTRFITHYATLCQQLGVDYFVVGTELTGTINHADRWRAVINSVRQIYRGPLTYAALSYIEDQWITWWDALDAIGVDAYFPLSLTTHPTLTQMRIGAIPAVFLLDSLSKRWNRPILFTEIGYMSVDGANRMPGVWWLNGPVDLQEQADCYQAIFEVFQTKAWWHGVFWWSWSVYPNQGGPSDKGYAIHNKPAERVLAGYYGGQPGSSAHLASR